MRFINNYNILYEYAIKYYKWTYYKKLPIKTDEKFFKRK